MIKLNKLLDKYGEYEINEEKLKGILEIPKQKTVWDLRVGDSYWFLDDGGNVCSNTWQNGEIDNSRRNVGNCFLTRKEAEFEVMRRKVETTLLKYGRREFLCYRDNWQLSYYNDLNKFDIGNYGSLANQGTIYFDTKELLNHAITAAGENNIKKYIFGVED